MIQASSQTKIVALNRRLTTALALSSRSQSRVKQQRLEQALDSLAEDLTLQQFLYDSTVLGDLLPKLWSCFALYAEERSLGPRSVVLLHKMLAHDFYGRKDTWQTAIEMMLKAEGLLRINSSVRATWYRVFLLDHAANRMVNPADSELRKATLTQVEDLLPDSLKTTSGVIQPGDVPFVLRAAHYWGHRANGILHGLQHDSPESRDDQGGAPWQLRISEGRKQYELAIRLRLAALKLSFGDVELGVDCGRWQPDVPVEGSTGKELEKLYTPMQGIADLANQFGALACLLCYAEPRAADAVREIESLATFNDRLWSQSRSVRQVWEDKLRTKAWSRMARLMVEIATKRRSNPMSDELSVDQKKILERFEALQRKP